MIASRTILALCKRIKTTTHTFETFSTASGTNLSMHLFDKTKTHTFETFQQPLEQTWDCQCIFWIKQRLIPLRHFQQPLEQIWDCQCLFFDKTKTHTFETFSTASGTNLGLSMYFLSFFSVASGMLSLSYSVSFLKN